MNALEFIKDFEKCRLAAYPDPESPRGMAIRAGRDDSSLDGNPWTIGWGHTGPEVKEGLTWTQEQADSTVCADVARVEHILAAMVDTALNPNQLAALTSLAFNIGLQAFERSTLLKRLNLGDYRGAAAEFPKWKLSKGRVVGGLFRRRMEERKLFLEPDGDEPEEES